jgi:Mn-dependent DtxR family transcriptional regulator
MKELDRDGCGVRCVDLASALNLSKPSVHNMMDTFSELGIISKTSYGVAHFTDSGNDTARRYGHYYEIVSESLRCMLPDIGDLQMAVCSLLSEVPQDSLEHMSRRYEQEREKSNGSSKV